MKILEDIKLFLKTIFVGPPKPSNLATRDNFWTYLHRDFMYTYLQFRLKYYVHDNQQSAEYRKLKTMWDALLVGLENSYIAGLAKAILPLNKIQNGKKKGCQRYPKQIAIETWLPAFKIRDWVALRHLRKWRNKVTVHIDSEMQGMADRKHMTSLMNEALQAMTIIAKSYEPGADYEGDIKRFAESSERDFSKLLEIIKKEL
ncbi:MAG: hypothetical protein Q8Q06_03065 [bacterium]|nr:hypothetical protein [bacterium]